MLDWWVWLVIAIGVMALIALVILLVINNKKNKQEGEEVPVESEEKPVKSEPAKENKKTEPKKKEEKKVEKADKKSPANKVYHIAKRKSDGMWQVKAAGAEKALKLFETQAEAIDYAKQVAGNQEAKIMIHKEDGSFRRLTYKK